MPSPQRKRRAALEREWEKKREAAIERDGWRCIVHPDRLAVAVNHIFSKGAWPQLYLDERNHSSLCHECHGDDANTEDFVKLQLAIMKKRNPEYNYNELPYSAYLPSKELK